jgi:4-hydroxy-tetrahydrodipicolinate reductase
MIRTVIAGAGGRMGRTLLSLLSEFPQLQLAGAVESGTSALLGTDAGVTAGIAPAGIKITADLPAALHGAHVLIDFSHASTTATHVAAARAAHVSLLLGTTGWSALAEKELSAASREIAVLPSANMSVGVALLADLVQRAAAALGGQFDIEIIEAHHKHKVDAPSGTALMLGEAAASGRNTTLASSRAPVDRNGQSRVPGQIGMSSIRGGDVVGEHEVHFLGNGERVVLKHSATDRTLFARGALRAAVWLAGKAPGRYKMADVLFNKS